MYTILDVAFETLYIFGTGSPCNLDDVPLKKERLERLVLIFIIACPESLH